MITPLNNIEEHQHAGSPICWHLPWQFTGVLLLSFLVQLFVQKQHCGGGLIFAHSVGVIILLLSSEIVN